RPGMPPPQAGASRLAPIFISRIHLMNEDANGGMSEGSLDCHAAGEDRSGKTETIRNTCWRTVLGLLLSIMRIMLVGQGNGRMLTLTFRDNVEDLGEAWKAWQGVRPKLL